MSKNTESNKENAARGSQGQPVAKNMLRKLLSSVKDDALNCSIKFNFAGSASNNAIYANGLNEIELIVQYQITQGQGAEATPVPDQNTATVTLVDYTTRENLASGWQYVRDNPAHNYVNPFFYQGRDEEAPISGVRNDYETKDSNGWITRHLFVSHQVSQANSTQKIAAKVSYKNTSWDTTQFGQNVCVTLVSVAKPPSYTIDNLQGYGGAAGQLHHVSYDGQLPDDYWNKNDDMGDDALDAANFFRQNNYYITLKNGAAIQDYNYPGGSESWNNVYTSRTRNFYSTDAYLWPIGSPHGQIYLGNDNYYADNGWLQTKDFEATKGIVITLVTKIEWDFVSRDTGNKLNTVTFHDEYGNDGQFYLNLELPKYYSGIVGPGAPNDYSQGWQVLTRNQDNALPYKYIGVPFWRNKAYGYVYGASNQGMALDPVLAHSSISNPNDQSYWWNMSSGIANPFGGIAMPIFYCVNRGANYGQIFVSTSDVDHDGDNALALKTINDPSGVTYFDGIVAPLWLQNSFRIFGWRYEDGDGDVSTGWLKVEHGYENDFSDHQLFISKGSFIGDGNPDRFVWWFEGEVGD